MAGVADLVALANLQKMQQEQEQGEKIPPKFLEQFAAQSDAMRNLERMIELKTKGFGGQGIDTGPLAGRVPNLLSQYVADLEGIPIEQQADRKKLEQATLNLLNPTRKEITGAAAPAEELRQFIAPLVPQVTENDPGWLASAEEAARAIATRRKSAIEELTGLGYRAPEFNQEDYLNRVRQSLYGK